MPPRIHPKVTLAYLPTGIKTLDELLRLPPDDPPRGIAYCADAGFFGVIFGAAGSGKSILSLQLCCAFATRGTRQRPHHAVYLTQESWSAVNDRAVYQFARFSSPATPPSCRLIAEREQAAAWDGRISTVTVVQMPLEPVLQKQKLDYFFPLIAEKLETQRLHPDQLLLCLDNAEIIAPTSYPDEVHRTLAGQREDLFFKALRQYCGSHKLNVWFAFEEERIHCMSDEDTTIATTPEAYAADIVLRLGVRVFPNRYRERSLEILKARYQPYRRGRHHFTIVPASKHLQGGIVVFPSLATQLQILGRRDPALGGMPKPLGGTRTPRSRLGIKAVDQGVQWCNAKPKDRLRWGSPSSIPEEKLENYLDAGTVSVLVSDLDSEASEIALHYALQDTGRTLYISTLHQQPQLEAMIEQYSTLQTKAKEGHLDFMVLPPEHISEGKLLKDIQRWIQEGVQTPTAPQAAVRVVLDNVFRLSKKFPLLHDEEHFLAAVFALFRWEQVAALVVDMVEVGEGSNPIHASYAAGHADHVFVLRHVELRSVVSKVFSVTKLAGRHEPDMFWELQSRPDRIVAEDRLAFFKGVLSGKPEVVEVVLSLFAEAKDSPVHEYLESQCKTLQATFGHELKVHFCHPETYSAMQQSVELHNLSALGDCHVIAIDEIWLGELLRRRLLRDFHLELPSAVRTAAPGDDRWQRIQYVTTGQDIAIAREVNWLKAAHGGTGPTAQDFQQLLRGNFAIPERCNLGVLTYNPGVLHSVVTGPAGSAETIESFLKRWAPACLDSRRTPPQVASDLAWQDLVTLQTRFTQSLARHWGLSTSHRLSALLYRIWENEDSDEQTLEASPPLPESDRAIIRDLPEAGVFTFSMETRETCVSFFLELLLSLTPKGQFPVRTTGLVTQEMGKLNWGRRIPWASALVLMLKLMSPWDITRLSHAWFRPARVERPCLFARQWYTGWGMREKTQPGLLALELPKGKSGLPATVSGAWYLGILEGGSAVRAGLQVIKQLASPDQELHKFNRGIGLPVRRALYRAARGGTGHGLVEGRRELPYAKGMLDVAKGKESRRTGTIPQPVLTSRCPFFREVIRNYRHVSPLLMGMLVKAAAIASSANWLWSRTQKDFTTEIVPRIRQLVKNAELRYEQIDRAYMRERNAAASGIRPK